MGCGFLLIVYIVFLVLCMVNTIVGYMIHSKIMIRVGLVLAVLSLISYPLYFYGQVKECATEVILDYEAPEEPIEPRPQCGETCPIHGVDL